MTDGESPDEADDRPDYDPDRTRDDDAAPVDRDDANADRSGANDEAASESPAEVPADSVADGAQDSASEPTDGVEGPAPDPTKDDGGAAAGPVEGDVPPDVRKYDRFKKIEGGTYDRANDFLRERTYVTAREWAIARLCADFRTETGVEMTKIGENLPELVPFMTDTYTPQAVNQARAAFEEKVRKAGATFLYGAMCDFFTAEQLDDVMYEATEVAKFLLEVEGVELTVEEEQAAEDHVSEVMREVREHSAALRHDEVKCPECGQHFGVDAKTSGGSADGSSTDGATADGMDTDGTVGTDGETSAGRATDETAPEDATADDAAPDDEPVADEATD